MKTIPSVVAALFTVSVLATPAHAIPGPPCTSCSVATLSSITFTGTGTVGTSVGPLAPVVGSANTISGAITLSPWITTTATGTYDLSTFPSFWAIQDSFVTSPDSTMPGAFGSIDVAASTLTNFYFTSGVFTEFLTLTPTTFFGYIYDPFDSSNDSSYSGTWAVGSTNVQRTAGSVPEPASWALMITGFGVAGTALRRRRTQQIA